MLSVTHSFLGRCAADGTFASASMLAHGGLIILSHRWRQVSRGLKCLIDNLLAKEVKGRGADSPVPLPYVQGTALP